MPARIKPWAFWRVSHKPVFKRFEIKVKDKICIDAGISTGGFTDCLLQQGAKLVYGIDVGYGQTAWKIRNNPKVILLNELIFEI